MHCFNYVTKHSVHRKIYLSKKTKRCIIKRREYLLIFKHGKRTLNDTTFQKKNRIIQISTFHETNMQLKFEMILVEFSILV
jgi:hypothetical protein